MNYFWNLSTNTLVQGLTTNAPVNNLNFKFGDNRTDTLYFCDNGQVVDPGPVSITLGIKLPGAVNYLVSALPTNVTKNGSGTTANFVINTNFSTTQLVSALNLNTNNELSSLSAEMAISYVLGTTTLETATIPVTIYRRINEGDEGTVNSANLVYPLPNALEVNANKGAAGGYAPLGTDAKVPSAYLPTISSAWSAITGIPAWITAATDFGKSVIAATNAAAAKTLLSLVKGDVGLGNVDNTADSSKPVSTAQASADAAVQAYAIKRANHTGTQLSSTISDKGVAGGVASLDGGGKIPVSQLPSSLMQYIGAWNASTNTPTLSNGTGIAGNVYNVTVAGTVLGESWNVGDWAIYNGSVWERSPNADDLLSVNGKTGAVVLTTTDISEGTNLYFTTARALAAVTWSTLTGIPAWIVAATAYGQSLIAATNAAEAKTLLSLTSSDVGLGNVNNTSDANKPVSTAQAAINATLAPLASPALTGNPTAPTQNSGDNSTKIATTGFVSNAISSITSAVGAIVSGVSSVNGKTGSVSISTSDVGEGATNLYFTSSRVLSSIITGLSTASTATINTSDTVLSALGKLQAQLISQANAWSVSKANINSPTFTGTPTAPTPTAGDSSNKIATTAFVAASVGVGAVDIQEVWVSSGG